MLVRNPISMYRNTPENGVVVYKVFETMTVHGKKKKKSFCIVCSDHTTIQFIFNGGHHYCRKPKYMREERGDT